MKSALTRSFPVGLALLPVGFLFGVLASQQKWSVLDVFMLGALGFTGSGQFAFLTFAQQGVETIGWPVIFAVILSMNLRYIPMSMSASQPLPLSTLKKMLIAHCLADESYAIESRADSVRSRAIIRACIFLFWVLSTVAGCALAVLLPDSVSRTLAGLTFPASLILFLLSLMNLTNFVTRDAASTRTTLVGVLACVALALLLIAWLGKRYFWVPGIVLCYVILDRVEERSSR